MANSHPTDTSCGPGAGSSSFRGAAMARRRSIRSRQQYLPVDVGNVGVAAKSHGQLELAIDDLEAARHALFAHRAQAVEERPTDQHAARPERPRLQDVLARADAAVHPDFDPRSDGL